MMKRWFFSYLMFAGTPAVNAAPKVGCVVHNSEEHPVATVTRWHERELRETRRSVVLLSFQEVGPEVPDLDREGWL